MFMIVILPRCCKIFKLKSFLKTNLTKLFWKKIKNLVTSPTILISLFFYLNILLFTYSNNSLK